MTAVREFALPDLGEGLTEATVVRWLVAVGDVVSVDQPVVEVETAKALVDVPCPYGGVVTARFGDEGAEIPVGAPLVTVAVGASPGNTAKTEATATSGKTEEPVEPEELAETGKSEDPGKAGELTEAGKADGSAAQHDPRAAGSGDSASRAADSDEADSGATGESSGNVLVGYGTTATVARRRRSRAVGLSGVPSHPGAGAGPVPGTATGAEDGAARAHAGTAGADSDGGDYGDVGYAVGRTVKRTVGNPVGNPVGNTDGDTDGDGSRGTGEARGEARGTGEARAPVPANSPPVPVISPLVRRLAREHGVDLHGLQGSGPYGLILRADVDRAVHERGGTPPSVAAGVPSTDTAPTMDTAPPTETGTPPVETGTPSSKAAPCRPTPPAWAPTDMSAPAPERVPLTGVRGAVADKMDRSRREIPDATCWVDADATELLAARRVMNDHGDARGAPRVSLLALLARICTAALGRFPELNATVDRQAREIVRLPGVHLGFAAQTERGLVVPVVRDAHVLDTAGLEAEIARLTTSARAGTLTPRELTGGTFTLNNYGVFGVDGSTPILNHPEAGMLGVGRIAEKPWAVQGELALRRVVQLSFTFDHRVCDGGTAGGFLRYVADCVEQPAVLLRTL
jgi:2-oxoisovalerate dehydrogenase E2 component (dihydrolipoyl transacylase)